MIDHVALEVRDYRRSKDSYLAALTPLGFELGFTLPKWPPSAARERDCI